jgi:hypothetical protein
MKRSIKHVIPMRTGMGEEKSGVRSGYDEKKPDSWLEMS